MKATELMIGDWVVNPVHKDKRKIEGVYYDKELHHLVATDGRFPQEYFDPIPLASEILEKNGWVFNDVPFINGWEFMGLTIHDWSISCGINISMNVRYVHELQHALRLCGLTELADNLII